MTNFTTQKQYNLYCDYLNALCSIVKDALGINSDKSKGYPNKSFKDNLGNRAVLVSDPTDGDQYGILSGELYPPSLLLHINVLLKAEGKDLPIWHSDYESLEYHTRQVCSKDFRFIHQINALPKSAKEIPTHSEILAHIENNPVGTNGYTNSGTPTDKTYQDAKRELEGEKATVTLDPVIIEDPEITGGYVPDLDELIAEDEKFIEGIE